MSQYSITPADLISEARTWLNTPFVHQARIKHVGVDCAGVIVGVAQALGLAIEDMQGYAREPKPGELARILDSQFARANPARPGDILMMVMDVDPQHLALLAGETIIHAHYARDPRIAKVIEHRYAEHWRRRTVGAWRFNELADTGFPLARE